jgi:hypothetical protein|eukprot:COSAG01_NODE_10035_length_2268_cov_4.029046_2_plen_73_part_00
MSRLFLSRNIEDGNGRAGYPELFPESLKQPFAAATAQLMRQVGTEPSVFHLGTIGPYRLRFTYVTTPVLITK